MRRRGKIGILFNLTPLMKYKTGLTFPFPDLPTDEDEKKWGLKF